MYHLFVALSLMVAQDYTKKESNKAPAPIIAKEVAVNDKKSDDKNDFAASSSVPKGDNNKNLDNKGLDPNKPNVINENKLDKANNKDPLKDIAKGDFLEELKKQEKDREEKINNLAKKDIESFDLDNVKEDPDKSKNDDFLSVKNIQTDIVNEGKKNIEFSSVKNNSTDKNDSKNKKDIPVDFALTKSNKEEKKPADPKKDAVNNVKNDDKKLASDKEMELKDSILKKEDVNKSESQTIKNDKDEKDKEVKKDAKEVADSNKKDSKSDDKKDNIIGVIPDPKSVTIITVSSSNDKEQSDEDFRDKKSDKNSANEDNLKKTNLDDKAKKLNDKESKKEAIRKAKIEKMQKAKQDRDEKRKSKILQLKREYLQDFAKNLNIESDQYFIVPPKKIEPKFVVKSIPPELLDRSKTFQNRHNPDLTTKGEVATLMFQAISKNEISDFRSLFEVVRDPNYMNANGDTLLIFAILMQKYDAISFILASGANPNLKNSLGYTPLNIAITLSDYVTTELLIRAGADLKYTDAYGSTYLMEAMKAGYFPIIDLLVEKGLDVNAVDKDGFSALDIAYHNKQEIFAKYLRKKGATSWSKKDYKKENPLIEQLQNRWK